MNTLVTITEHAVPTSLREALEDAAEFARADRAESTKRAYESDHRLFAAWCRERTLCPLPAQPGAVAAFLADEAKKGRRPSTLGRRTAALKWMHRKSGHPSPTDDERVKSVMSGIKRTIGTAPRKLAPATNDRIIAMQAMTRQDVLGKRDKAILTLGFAIAARRSELVSLDIDHITFCNEGMKVRIKRSKTDQHGMGAEISVPYGEIACPIAALREWLAVAGITEGPIFRSIRRGGHVTNKRLGAKTVREVVKRQAAKVGLNPKDFAAHSLRAGFATSAASAGKSLWKIMDTTRHRSTDTLRGYIRSMDGLKDNACSGLL
jgi:site-specific recombinase XerD